jgi:hypothetical protein
MLSRRTLVRMSMAVGLVGGLAGLASSADWRGENMSWRPISWPFPRDGWADGRAWRNSDDVEVYLRPKLGFCGNCDTGVVADEEVDRVTDIDLLDERFAAVQTGAQIRIATLAGRARLYRLKTKDGTQRLAEGIAVAQKCDLVVAIIVGSVIDEPTRHAAHRFLESHTVQAWLARQLEGR